MDTKWQLILMLKFNWFEGTIQKPCFNQYHQGIYVQYFSVIAIESANVEVSVKEPFRNNTRALVM